MLLAEGISYDELQKYIETYLRPVKQGKSQINKSVKRQAGWLNWLSGPPTYRGVLMQLAGSSLSFTSNTKILKSKKKCSERGAKRQTSDCLIH